MKLADLIKDMDSVMEHIETDTSKVAAAQPQPTNRPAGKTASSLSDRDVLAALDEAIAEASQVKTASEANPASDLMKLAEELNDREFDGLVKKAGVLADAMADRMVARLEAYQNAMDYQKVASDFEKTAAESAQAGYLDGHAAVVKIAQDLAQAGYEDALQVIAASDGTLDKLAAAGAAHALEVINFLDEE